MAQPYPSSPVLSGPFEPIRFECDYADLVVEGRLPEALNGTFYRIGPNPQFAPRGIYNPLQGEGMVHAFRLGGGRAGYANRWVRTRRWALERDAGRALFSTSDPRDHDPAVTGVDDGGAANTHVIPFAGRLLALEEGHRPIALDPATLVTDGVFDFGGALTTNMTAHPKIDPVTGEMLFFANFARQAFDGRIAVYRGSADGVLTGSTEIKGPYPALVHDFAITESRLVFVICPVTLSLERSRAGRPPIAWEPDCGTFVGLLDRAASGEEVRWFRAPTGMAWHTANAFDDGACVQLDLCRQAAPAFPTPDGRASSEVDLQQFLTRWTIDPGRDEVASVRRLVDQPGEYPRIDERWTGRKNRFVFLATDGGPGTGDLCHRGIGRFDHETGAFSRWRAPDAQSVSEPVFVARTADAPEGSGWVLTVAFDERRNASQLAVLNAEDLAAGPIATCLLDHRVPAGFHGSFAPAVQVR